MKNKIRVGAFDYTVRVEKNPKREKGIAIDGQCRNTDATIRIRKMSEQAMRQTLWHETIHALCWQHGIKLSDEKEVDRLATGIMQVIKDNRWITK